MNQSQWNSIVGSTPSPHFLQTWEWAEVKKKYGWEPIFQDWMFPGTKNSACALILKRSLAYPVIPFRPSMLYTPKGPLTDWHNLPNAINIFADIENICKKNKSIYVKIDPDVIVNTTNQDSDQLSDLPTGNEITDMLSARGWRYSGDQIQFKNTIILDLTGSEEDILARMKQKTRYNIRLAERKGVHVRKADRSDFPRLYKLYAETSIRDNFVIRPESYYKLVWDTFLSQNMAEFLIAEINNQIIAAIFVVCFKNSAWYLYGMSQNEHREKMPNHLLQWYAICEAKKKHITTYDLWGAPDIFNETDSMWGVYRFKEGFGGKVVQTIGAWDYPAYPQLYSLYTKIVPTIINNWRKGGLKDIRQNYQ